MIRIIVKGVSYAPLSDSHAEPWFKTFDVDAPELEQYLRLQPSYGSAWVDGAELLPLPPPPEAP